MTSVGAFLAAEVFDYDAAFEASVGDKLAQRLLQRTFENLGTCSDVARFGTSAAAACHLERLGDRTQVLD
jgi:hypothetical protein